jgi:hypothetical protein
MTKRRCLPLMFLVLLNFHLTSANTIFITFQYWQNSSTCSGTPQSTSVNEPFDTCISTDPGSAEFGSSSLNFYSDNACANLIGTFQYGQCIDISGISFIFTAEGASCVNFDQKPICELQHEFRSGPCITATLNNNINISATGDHLIKANFGWRLFRELKVKDVLNDKIVTKIMTNEFCEKLSVCKSDNYTFNYKGVTFSTMTLMTPEDINKLPWWMKYINKFWVNI